MSPSQVTLKKYRLLLAQLLLLPVVTLALLALVLGYALQRVERSAARVDHSDLVLSHANRLIKLIVDQETGLRGFLLTRDPLFLAPYISTVQPIESEFDTLSNLTADNSGQNGRVQQLRSSYSQWEAEAQREVRSQVSDEDIESNMLRRKQSMDGIRAQMDGFVAQEEQLRTSRSVTARRVGRVSLAAGIAIFVLAAVLVVWATWRIYRKLTGAFNEQLAEINQQREEAYQREQWLNTTLRSIGDGVIACDPAGRVVFMNAVSEALTGWREHEARGLALTTIFEIVNEETRANVENPVDKVLRMGTVVGLANHTVLIRRDKSEIAIDDSAAPIRGSDSRLAGIVLVFRDVTERRNEDRALMRAEKLASVGRMAAAVAHEINNPLEAIINLVYLAESESDVTEIRRLMAAADVELKRISQVTRQTLGFYKERTGLVDFKPADLVRELAGFYGALAARRGINLIVNAASEDGIMGSPGELRQAIANLMLNSLEACQPGGTVRVDVRSVEGRRTGIRLTIADSGCGVPVEYRSHIFEPFFTTKPDTGVGLGLWVSKQLIEKHGGKIGLRSRTEGKPSGTVISIFVPQTPEVRQQRANPENGGAQAAV